MGSDGGNLFAALSDSEDPHSFKDSQTALFRPSQVKSESTPRGLFGDLPGPSVVSLFNREKTPTTNIFSPVSTSNVSTSHGLFGLPLSSQANNSALESLDEGTTSVAHDIFASDKSTHNFNSPSTSTSDGIIMPSSEQKSTSFHSFASFSFSGSRTSTPSNAMDSKEPSRSFASPFVWKRDSARVPEATNNLHPPSLFAAIDSKTIHPVTGLFKTATKNQLLFKQSEKPLHTQDLSVSPVSSISSPKGTFASPSAFECSPSSTSPTSAGSASVANVLPAIKLSNLPVGLNQKTTLTKLFSRFGSIQRIICQPSLDTALIAFASSAEAHKAKTEASRVTPGVTVSLAKCVKRNSGVSPTVSPQKPPSFFHQTKLTSPKCGPSSSGMSRRSAASLSSPSLTDTSVPTACTVDERLAVLEARDEAEHRRVALAKQAAVSERARRSPVRVGGTTGRSTVRGVCPDMCPETERYLRECRQRVSVFECLTSSLSAGSASWRLDHTRAVKDYSRSSADQAEPLPWELRPPDVLERTMAYLLASIADRPELDSSRSLWKPWYEFLWTRTRAIRKDITQQNIHSPTIIGIVEKVTRFHIFCAARLVDQPLDSFDPRINSENLTQCLQTLKQLYDDLKPPSLPVPAGAVDPCPCEAEFRAYMILMKLNDASVLAEVQKFPATLRKSAPVQFAMEVNFAVTERNFIRFFRLVRQADCLTACLLHRYFSQVRSQALFSMAAAFNGHPRHEVLFPLSTLVHQLAFESVSDAQAFCEHWGLSVTDTDLVFHRQCPPRLPELVWKERRAPSLIESKRSGIRLSALFNGGPVNPSDAIPPPVHSSFDAHNRLLPAPVSVLDAPVLTMETPDAVRPLKQDSSPPATVSTPASTMTPPASTVPPSAPAPAIPSQSPVTPLPHTVSSVSTRVQSKASVCAEPAGEGSGFSARSLATGGTAAVSEICDNFIADLVNDQIRQIAAPAIRERDAQIGTEVQNQVDHIVDATVPPLVESLCGRVCAEERVLSDLFDTLLCSLVRCVCKRSFLKYQAQQLNRLRTLCTYFEIWKMCLQRRQNKMKSQDLILSMPAYPSLAADAICLAGSRVATYCDRLQGGGSANSTDAPTPSKRTRFSKWADKVDFDLAWRPLDPLSNLEGAQLGILLPPSLPTTGLPPHSTSALLFSWLLAKLGRYRTMVLPSPPARLDLSPLSALIAVDMPQSAHECLRLPTLNVCTVPLDDSKPEPTGQVHVLRLALPTCHATLAYSWTPQLQDGLYWLSGVFEAEVLNRKQEPDHKDTTLALAEAPLVSTLMDATLIHVENCFLLPLLNLLENWNTQDLTDPSPRLILEAYNECVDHFHNSSLAILSPPPSASACNNRNLLRVDNDLLSRLPSSFPLGVTPAPSWEAAAKAWSLFVDSVLPDRYSLRVAKLSAVLFARRRTNLSQRLQSRNFDSHLGVPFAPWTAACIHFIRAKLEALCAACTDNPSPSASSLTQPIEKATEAHLLRAAADSLIADFSSEVTFLTTQWPGAWLEDFFASSGEPRYTFASVASFCDANSSTSPAPPLEVAQPTKTEQLLSQLDKLEFRLKRVSEEARSLCRRTQ
ncbi:Germinal-center associated nuclear protein [Sparganum proliferum]